MLWHRLSQKNQTKERRGQLQQKSKETLKAKLWAQTRPIRYLCTPQAGFSLKRKRVTAIAVHCWSQEIINLFLQKTPFKFVTKKLTMKCCLYCLNISRSGRLSRTEAHNFLHRQGQQRLQYKIYKETRFAFELNTYFTIW